MGQDSETKLWGKFSVRRRRTPTCKDCGQEHYNFQPCPDRQDLKPAVEWKTRTDESWGNKMIDLKHLGGNSFVQRGEWDR